MEVRYGPEADGPEAVLAALDPEQREVALATRGPVCVLAGAGTGKTRAIAHRIAYGVRIGVVNPRHVLAVTFTTRAAGELRGRLRQLAGAAGGGDGAGAGPHLPRGGAAPAQPLLAAHGGGRPPAVLDSKLSLLAEVARELRMQAGLPELRDAAAEIEWAKVSQVRPDDYPAAAAAAGRTPPLGAETTARLYAAYEQRRRERHLVDFESVLELTAAILAEHRLAAAEVADRYRYFVVDEFQDVNPLQKLLLDTWTAGRDDVCVVGDPRQTIYSFTGATPAYLTGFTAAFPHATVVRLVRNYRSTPQVVALANRLTGAVPGRRGTPAARGARCPAAPRSWRSGPLGRNRSSPATRTRWPRPRRSPPGRPSSSRPASRPARWPCWCGSTSRPSASSGRSRRRGCPSRCGGRNGSSSGPRCARRWGCCGPRPPPPGSPAPAAPHRRGAPARRRRSVAAARRGQARAVRARPHPGTTAGPGLGQGTLGVPGGAGPARGRLLRASRPARGWPRSSAQLAHRAAIEHPPAPEGVTVASLHAAKGLEWDVVFLPGLTEGNLPIVHAQTDEAVAEERRLLYVGVTRARERVCLSWALARAPGGRPSRAPSRFLDGLRPRRLAGTRDAGRAARDARRRASGVPATGGGPPWAVRCPGTGVARRRRQRPLARPMRPDRA